MAKKLLLLAATLILVAAIAVGCYFAFTTSTGTIGTTDSTSTDSTSTGSDTTDTSSSELE